MKLKRWSHAGLLLATFWGPCFVAVFCIWVIKARVTHYILHPDLLSVEGDVRLLAGCLAMAALTLVTLLILAATTLFYGVHVLRNANLSDTKKVLWSLLNVLVGPLAMPWYWFLYIRPEHGQS